MEKRVKDALVSKMKICLLDFDKTLIAEDSIRHIFIKEKIFLKPDFFALALIILIVNFLPKKNQIFFRSLFKKKLLLYISTLPKFKIEKYINYFKEKLNKNLIDFIKKKDYDEIIVVSGSEKTIIERTIAGIFADIKIISNECPKKGEKFETSWNYKKLMKLEIFLGDLSIHDLDLYTDSFDDLPLIKICNYTYIVKRNSISLL